MLANDELLFNSRTRMQYLAEPADSTPTVTSWQVLKDLYSRGALLDGICGYIADDCWVASTLMADTRTNSCGVADIRNVYVFPDVKGGTLNDAYPTTSFSYKCL